MNRTPVAVVGFLLAAVTPASTATGPATIVPVVDAPPADRPRVDCLLAEQFRQGP
jgi:hypothetical protein